jgi:hypothetical protein
MLFFNILKQTGGMLELEEKLAEWRLEVKTGNSVSCGTAKIKCLKSSFL